MSILTRSLLQRPGREPSAPDSWACGAAHVSGSAGVWAGKLQSGRGAAQTHQTPLCRDRGQWRSERCFQSASYSCCHEVRRQRTPTVCQIHADRERCSAAKLPAHRPADPESPLLTCLNSDPFPYMVNCLFSVSLITGHFPGTFDYRHQIREPEYSPRAAPIKVLCLMGSLLQQCQTVSLYIARKSLKRFSFCMI